jgi:hypothetical protein
MGVAAGKRRTSGENGFSLIMSVFPLGPHLILTKYCPPTTQPDIFDDGEKPGLCGLALVAKVVKNYFTSTAIFRLTAQK